MPLSIKFEVDPRKNYSENSQFDCMELTKLSDNSIQIDLIDGYQDNDIVYQGRIVIPANKWEAISKFFKNFDNINDDNIIISNIDDI